MTFRFCTFMPLFIVLSYVYHILTTGYNMFLVISETVNQLD